MLEETLSAFSKVVLGVISTVTVAGAATAAATVAAEKDLHKAKSVTYEAKSMNSQRSSMVEGCYWELRDIDHVLYGERDSLITDIMENLPDYGASYYYSFTENAVLSFMPVDDPDYAIDLWQRNTENEFSIISEMVPIIKTEYQQYKKDKTKWSDQFNAFMESIGIPIPSIVVTGYEWFKYDGIGTKMPNTSLTIASIDAQHMDLSYGDGNTILRYDRIKALPKEIAPITLYFQEKSFYYDNYDRIQSSDWRLTDEEIDAHFRKTFKSKKY